ncbi:hypothetical protein INT44_000370 [Umbelopsis vinacea]|uniref:Ribonuclease H2 subunit B wHTH domain-containing protein n=1 Tax=Umbelopsis vinacea TaxID=44442 RepID=A0A8H7PKU7_9FUNG|nr:hypothetical protein INT44_000370 [Umbelopsis vinacea]
MASQWVAIRPNEPEHADIQELTPVITYRTGDPSRYVLQQDGVLLEVQKVEAEHKQNGVLYMMTPIDPLFVLLPVLAETRKKSAESDGRFVQYDSIFSDADEDKRYQSLHRLADIPGLSAQLGHLCDQQEYIKDEFVYRLNEDKTLKWLRLKVQAVADNVEKMPILLQFINEQLFDIDAPQTDTNIRSDAYTWAGIQVVSEYITDAWQEKLNKSYTLTKLESQVEEHKKKQEIQFQNYVTHDPTEFAKAKREASDLSDQGSKKPKLSAGQKTLAKANIKGMKSLSSFFAKKIRTVTAFVALAPEYEDPRSAWEPLFRQAVETLTIAQAALEAKGYEVQTTRIATNPFPEFTRHDTMENACTVLDEICSDLGIMMLNIGPASDVDIIARIPHLIAYAIQGAKVINAIADHSPDLNFRFCVSANTKPGIPFFPVGYGPSYAKDSASQISFALGLECSDLVVVAFERARKDGSAQGDDQDPWDLAEKYLRHEMESACKPVEHLMQSLVCPASYTGIDVSVAPTCGSDAIDTSLVTAYEAVIPKFGGAGTLTISAMITGVLKTLDILKCGYSGLMLPIMEDAGLAKRFAERTYSVQEVLLYSTVCGCGLDCVPIAGDTPLKALANLLADMATLAYRLNKPLSARMFPFPELKQDMATEFDNPLLVNTKVVKLE